MVGAVAYLAVASANGTLIHAAPDLQQLTWFERSGKQLGTLGDRGQFWHFLRFSPDGQQVAITRIETGRELWLLDVERGTSRRTTFDSRGGFYPLWSPDSRTILFSGDNVTALYRKDASGSTPDQRLAAGTRDLSLTDWSIDGRFALNNRLTPDTRQDIWVVPVTPDGHLDPSAQPRAYLRTPASELWGRFSREPNPRWVAYQSDENGRNEVYVQSFPEPRLPHRISVNGGEKPQWGPGGHELFYKSLDNKVMVVRLELGADTVGVSTPQELFAIPADSFFDCPRRPAFPGERGGSQAAPADRHCQLAGFDEAAPSRAIDWRRRRDRQAGPISASPDASKFLILSSAWPNNLHGFSSSPSAGPKPDFKT